jgi:hypothetical protein
MKRFALFFFISACGSNPPIVPGNGESLFPLASNHRWTFAVSESDGDLKTKVQTITGTTANGGWIMRTETGNDRTVSVQRLEGTQLVRDSEEVFENDLLKDRVRFSPPALRVDVQESELGATYESEHDEEHLDANGDVLTRVSKKHQFVIEAADEAITVPAGDFRAVRVRRDTEGGAAKTYWYVRGVGKIREVGGQVEELMSFEQGGGQPQ